MNRLVAVLLGAAFAVAALGRGPTFQEYRAVQDSLHRMPLCSRSRWLASETSELHLKQVASLDRGQYWTSGRVVKFQPAPASSPFLVFRGEFPFHHFGVFFCRYTPVNRYVLAKLDTGNMGSGLVPGNMVPWAAGDVDRTGRPKLLASNTEFFPDSSYALVAVYSSSPQNPCPDSLTWRCRYDSAIAYDQEPFYVADLDQDSAPELVAYTEIHQQLYILENVGPDSFRLVWTTPLRGYAFAFGDFDEDGLEEFATAGHDYDNWVRVLKCTGDDQYEFWDSVGIHLPNGQDVFAARNLGGTDRAVPFVSFMEYMSGGTYLYTCEPTQGTKGYELFLVDSSTCLDWHFARSCCADVDGDGVEGVFWSCGTHIPAYKKTGPHQFEQCWYWSSEDTSSFPSCNITSCDINGNGYNELIVSGSGRTFIFEADAIQVLSPNGGQVLDRGDTCQIRWRTLTPPRCDSVSLFLWSDTAIVNGFYRLDTIAHGLSPTDSTYSWVVPDTSLDSARIMAIASGPGWRFDDSDSTFAISPPGIVEARQVAPRGWALSVSPNPVRGEFGVRYDVPRRSRVSVGLYDVNGRLVGSLSEGYVAPGRHEEKLPSGILPAGVYFCTLITDDQRSSRKLVLPE